MEWCESPIGPIFKSSDPFWVNLWNEVSICETLSKTQVSHVGVDQDVLTSFDDCVTTFQRDLQRLLDDHMLSCIGSGNCRLHMGTAGSTNRNNINLFVGQHLTQGIVSTAVVLAGKFISVRFVAM